MIDDVQPLGARLSAAFTGEIHVAKRICIFLDGSSASAAVGGAQRFSNVFRMNLALYYDDFDGNLQQAMYFAGVGTRGDKTSGASGRGLDQIIGEAYVNISSNYQEGDQIYLFGWSRGAAAARAVAGLITKVGLLGPDWLQYIDTAWKLYRLRQIQEFSPGDYTMEDRSRDERLSGEISEKLWGGSAKPKIRLLGLFDTVPGNEWDTYREFSNVRFYKESLESDVDVGIHILSIDDRRASTFKPLLWTSRRPDQVLEQIWMPGAHADIGGNSGCGFIADAALATMIDRVRAHCPELKFADWNLERLTADRWRYKVYEISDELKGFSFFLPRLKRYPAASHFEAQYIHPVTHSINQETVSSRGRQVKYAMRSDFQKLPVVPLGEFGSGWQALYSGK